MPELNVNLLIRELLGKLQKQNASLLDVQNICNNLWDIVLSEELTGDQKTQVLGAIFSAVPQMSGRSAPLPQDRADQVYSNLASILRYDVEEYGGNSVSKSQSLLFHCIHYARRDPSGDSLRAIDGVLNKYPDFFERDKFVRSVPNVSIAERRRYLDGLLREDVFGNSNLEEIVAGPVATRFMHGSKGANVDRNLIRGIASKIAEDLNDEVFHRNSNPANKYAVAHAFLRAAYKSGDVRVVEDITKNAWTRNSTLDAIHDGARDTVQRRLYQPILKDLLEIAVTTPNYSSNGDDFPLITMALDKVTKHAKDKNEQRSIIRGAIATALEGGAFDVAQNLIDKVLQKGISIADQSDDYDNFVTRMQKIKLDQNSRALLQQLRVLIPPYGRPQSTMLRQANSNLRRSEDVASEVDDGASSSSEASDVDGIEIASSNNDGSHGNVLRRPSEVGSPVVVPHALSLTAEALASRGGGVVSGDPETIEIASSDGGDAAPVVSVGNAARRASLTLRLGADGAAGVPSPASGGDFPEIPVVVSRSGSSNGEANAASASSELRLGAGQATAPEILDIASSDGGNVDNAIRKESADFRGETMVGVGASVDDEEAPLKVLTIIPPQKGHIEVNDRTLALGGSDVERGADGLVEVELIRLEMDQFAAEVVKERLVEERKALGKASLSNAAKASGRQPVASVSDVEGSAVRGERNAVAAVVESLNLARVAASASGGKPQPTIVSGKDAANGSVLYSRGDDDKAVPEDKLLRGITKTQALFKGYRERVPGELQETANTISADQTYRANFANIAFSGASVFDEFRQDNPNYRAAQAEDNIRQYNKDKTKFFFEGANFSNCVFKDVDLSMFPAEVLASWKLSNCRFEGDCTFPRNFTPDSFKESQLLAVVSDHRKDLEYKELATQVKEEKRYFDKGVIKGQAKKVVAGKRKLELSDDEIATYRKMAGIVAGRKKSSAADVDVGVDIPVAGSDIPAVESPKPANHVRIVRSEVVGKGADLFDSDDEHKNDIPIALTDNVAVRALIEMRRIPVEEEVVMDGDIEADSATIPLTAREKYLIEAMPKLIAQGVAADQLEVLVREASGEIPEDANWLEHLTRNDRASDKGEDSLERKIAMNAYQVLSAKMRNTGVYDPEFFENIYGIKDHRAVGVLLEMMRCPSNPSSAEYVDVASEVPTRLNILLKNMPELIKDGVSCDQLQKLAEQVVPGCGEGYLEVLHEKYSEMYPSSGGNLGAYVMKQALENGHVELFKKVLPILHPSDSTITQNLILGYTTDIRNAFQREDRVSEDGYELREIKRRDEGRSQILKDLTTSLQIQEVQNRGLFTAGLHRSTTTAVR